MCMSKDGEQARIDGDKIWGAFRKAQALSGCANKTRRIFEDALRPLLPSHEWPTEGRQTRILCRKAGALVIQLHGCVGCDDYVFVPTDRAIKCPKCDFPRFDAKKQPNEVNNFLFSVDPILSFMFSVTPFVHRSRGISHFENKFEI